MDFTKSSLWKDTQRVINNGKYLKNKITADFYVAGELFKSIKVETVDISRDYHQQFADVVIIQALIGAGSYAIRFYPNLDNIECVLTFMPSGADGERQGYVDKPRVERYKAIMLNPSTRAIDLNRDREISEESLNLKELVTAQFQLINKVVDQLRGVIMGNVVFRDCKVDDILKHILTKHTKEVKNIDKEQIPIGIDMVPTNAIATREYTLVPPIKVTELPEYLHRQCDGVYPTGIACYYQGNHWYVFPPYDVSRFNKTPNNLTVINIPAGVLRDIERSYLLDGPALTILATGDTKLSNDSDKTINQHGSGVRFANANEFMENFVDVKDNIALASRGKNVTEYSSINRPDNKHLSPVSKDRITSNNLYQMSQMALKDGALFTVTWQNAVHFQLYPGMPSRVMYLDNGLAKYIDAVLLKAHYFYYPSTGSAGNSYHCEASLTFFIQRKQRIHD